MEDSKEINKTKCSKCQDIKIRIQDGKYPDNRNKKWVDETGDCWVGLRCPSCVRENMKLRMKKVRSKGKIIDNV